MSAVYASPCLTSRESLWFHLSSLRRKINHSWLPLGDFNDILHPSKVSSGIFYYEHAEKFAWMINNCDLLNLGFKGHPCTWRSTARNCTRVAKRLDRALVDMGWRMAFPKAPIIIIFSLTPTIILLVCFVIGINSFEAVWTCQPSFCLFVDVVKEA